MIYTLFKQVDIRYMDELNPEIVLDVDITTKTGQLVTDCICRSTHRHLLVCEIVNAGQKRSCCPELKSYVVVVVSDDILSS